MKNWIVARFPAIFFVVGTLAAAGALIRAIQETESRTFPIPVLMISVYLCWVFLEARTTFRTARLQGSQEDHGTEILYGLSRFATVLAAVYGPVPPQSRDIWAPVPFVLLLAGIALRLASIRALGRFYSHRVRTADDHQITTSGPYRLLRHPAYAGMILAHIGLVSYFFNPISFGLLLLLFVPAILRRIFVEERLMVTVAGYRDFMAGRKRIVPFVW